MTISAKGLSSLVGGHLVSLGWSLPQVFALTAVTCGSGTVLVLLVYHAWVKEQEDRLMVERENLLRIGSIDAKCP